ncbi:MAG: hypothetical protein D4R97_04275 [Bacteroidetes bacterium]|nr:MAG: hypothetical protein D4R97_04275 [Bacteroidota bacterium]
MESWSFPCKKYFRYPGTAAFPFDLRKPGKYQIEFLLRERDKNSWEESSWVPISCLDFILTEKVIHNRTAMVIMA